MSNIYRMPIADVNIETPANSQTFWSSNSLNARSFYRVKMIHVHSWSRKAFCPRYSETVYCSCPDLFSPFDHLWWRRRCFLVMPGKLEELIGYTFLLHSSKPLTMKKCRWNAWDNEITAPKKWQKFQEQNKLMLLFITYIALKITEHISINFFKSSSSSLIYSWNFGWYRLIL